MIQNILFAIWFLLPAAVANAVPVIAAAVPSLKKLDAPLDGGMKFHGHRLFGSHKTWRGLVAGIITATLVLFIQQLLFISTNWAGYISGGIDYSQLPVLLLGPLFAIGALGGDAIESFFKRQRGIKSGKSWVPFDQLDYIIGSVLVTLPFVRLEFTQYIWIFIIWFFMHLVASYIGFRMGLKKDPI